MSWSTSRPTIRTFATVAQRPSSFWYYELGKRAPVLEPAVVLLSAAIQVGIAGAGPLAGRRGDTLCWVALGRRPA